MGKIVNESVFEQRFQRALERTVAFARRQVVETLPDSVRIKLCLGQWTEQHAVSAEKDIQPLPPALLEKTEEQLAALTPEECVELLCYEGRVPGWINLSVVSEDGQNTFVEAVTSGWMTSDESLLHEGTNPPFQVRGPSAPPSRGPDSLRTDPWSLYWKLELSSVDELGKLEGMDQNLEVLRLNSSSLDGSHLGALAHLSGLSQLYLRKVRLKGPELSCLTSLEGLRILRLARIADSLNLDVIEQFNYLDELIITGESLRLNSLKLSPSLTKLTLTLSSLTSLEALALSSTTLQSLDLGESGLQTLDGLQNLPELEALYLTNTAVSDDSIAKLIELPKLRRICLQGTKVTDQALDVLNEHPGEHLRVRLRGTSVSSEKIEELITAHPTWRLWLSR